MTPSESPTTSVFGSKEEISGGFGARIYVTPFTKTLAHENGDAFLALHHLIPRVDAWSLSDLLADGDGDRLFEHKWTLSVAVWEEGRSSPIGFLIGYLRLSANLHPLDSVYIHRFAIAPTHQRKGIGAAVLHRYLSRVFGALPWLQSVTVQTNDTQDNEWVVRFYEKSGFRRLFRVPYLSKTDWLLQACRSQTRIDVDDRLTTADIAHPRFVEPVHEPVVIFVSTTNSKKFAEIQTTFADFNVVAVQAAPPRVDLTEPQIEGANPDTESELVRHPLRLAARFLEVSGALPFVVEDTMLYIEHFNRDFESMPELPGYDTKRWWRQMGTEGLLALMNGAGRRKAKYVSQLGGYVGNGQYVVARGETFGTIANEARISQECLSAVPRTSPWFFHSVFIPDGSQSTFGEMGPAEFARYDYKRKAALSFLRQLRIEKVDQLHLPLERFNG